MEFLRLFFFLPLFLFSCGKYMPTELRKPANLSFTEKNLLNLIITSDFITNDNKTNRPMTFDSGQKRLLILISSRGCTSCKEEHQMIAAKIKSNELESSKFNIISLVVGYDLADSYQKTIMEEFIAETNQTWPITGDPDLTYFNSLCPYQETPCSAILEPTVGLVFSHNGIPKIEDLKSLLNK